MLVRVFRQRPQEQAKLTKVVWGCQWATARPILSRIKRFSLEIAQVLFLGPQCLTNESRLGGGRLDAQQCRGVNVDGLCKLCRAGCADAGCRCRGMAYSRTRILFDNIKRCEQGTGNTTGAQALAKKMATALANFARTGTPASRGLRGHPAPRIATKPWSSTINAEWWTTPKAMCEGYCRDLVCRRDCGVVRGHAD